MTKLLFVRQPHVYLPEISAYKSYLAKQHPTVQTFESTDLQTYSPTDYDILWHFMGQDIKGQGNYVVHEYNSLSTQPFASTKNFIKRMINARPDQRVFLNEIVSKAFNFKDSVPHFLRDMGVDDAFYSTKLSHTPQYDFICVGGLNREPTISQFLEHFSQKMSDATLLLVGDAPAILKQRFRHAENITFKGRVSYQDIPNLMAQAKYGLNLMPDIYPFNIQTATKVLEYAALNLPIISTNYQWIKDFENDYKTTCFKLSANMENLSLQKLHQFEFKIPDISSLRWHNVIEQSGIFSFLK